MSLFDLERFYFLLGKVTVLIPAGGEGSRFSTSQKKQFYLLQDGQTILEKTLSIFSAENLQGGRPGQIVCVCCQNQIPSEIYKRIEKQFPDIQWALPGLQRMDSVWNGLKKVKTPWVLIHDAVRPLLSFLDIYKIILQVELYCCDGAVLATPMRDAVKKVCFDSISGTHIMSEIVDRKEVWATLTPQLFPTNRIIKAVQRALDLKIVCFDEAEAIFFDSGAPKIIPTNCFNPKITYPEDLIWMKMFFQ